MSTADRKRGGALVGAMAALEGWQSELVMDFRLWCDGPAGQVRVWNRVARALGHGSLRADLEVFERLITTIGTYSYRPLVRRDLACTCICSDEAVFLHLVDVASEGDLREASKIASLLVTASHAEGVALMAAQVGDMAKAVSRAEPSKASRSDSNVVRLH
ncbi:MAG: hypothetical protein AAF566_01200 [Pseudomonadota bacterium]